MRNIELTKKQRRLCGSLEVGEAPNSLVGDELHCQGHEGVLRPRPATSQDVSFLRLFHLFFDLGEERLGYLSPRSGKAVEFNQVSVSFCFRIDGTFFLRKQGQHLKWRTRKFSRILGTGRAYFAQQSRPTMIKRKMRKKNVKPERA